MKIDIRRLGDKIENADQKLSARFAVRTVGSLPGTAGLETGASKNLAMTLLPGLTSFQARHFGPIVGVVPLYVSQTPRLIVCPQTLGVFARSPLGFAIFLETRNITL
jgi:hypothetical protein